MRVTKEYLFTVYFLKNPLHPHSRHLYTFAIRDDLTVDSIIFFALLLLITPILPQEGHLVVSGNDLKNIFSCKFYLGLITSFLIFPFEELPLEAISLPLFPVFPFSEP